MQKIDKWELISTERGIQVRKNGANHLFHKTLAGALGYIQIVSTLGDTISMYIEDIEITTVYNS